MELRLLLSDPVIIRPHRRTKYVCGHTVTDQVAWSEGLSLGLSLTVVSPAKTAQPMPFGLWTQVGRRKHVLHGVH